MRDLISVIVPIYNVAQYLPQCLDSILCQTYPDLEILLIDDGSTDCGGAVCDAYARRDARIRVIHKENGGLVSARKAGVRAAKGRYIGYVDGDDWIASDMYEMLYDRLCACGADIAMCGHWNDTGDDARPVRHGMAAGCYDRQRLMREVYPKMIAGGDFFTWNIFPAVWDKLFRRESLIPFQLAVDERIVIGEDVACAYPALFGAKSVCIMDECLYHYRQSVGSMVKRVQDYEREREQFRILYRSVDAVLAKYDAIPGIREQWVRYMLFLMMPRVDSLYGGYESLEYLFPFRGVQKGRDIVLYCAGTFGQRLHGWLQKTGFCRVALWVDRNYAAYQKMGLAVHNPEELAGTDCDTVVIANMYAKAGRQIRDELVKKYPGKNICLMDETLVFSAESRRAFGLD